MDPWDEVLSELRTSKWKAGSTEKGAPETHQYRHEEQDFCVARFLL